MVFPVYDPLLIFSVLPHHDHLSTIPKHTHKLIDFPAIALIFDSLLDLTELLQLAMLTLQWEAEAKPNGLLTPRGEML